MPLSDIKIRNLKPMGKPYKVSDFEGLFVLVKVSGAKSWRFKYRIDGKEKLLVIGDYPACGLAQARKARDDAKALLSQGIDPSESKQEEKRIRIEAKGQTFERIGDDHEPRRFKVWAPKCIAMIGKLPDTLEDRALVVPLRRKQSGEVVERFRADRLNEFLPLRRMAARWADDNTLRLAGVDPIVPGELNDGAQDNARAICAIADLAGGEWPQLVRAPLVGIAARPDDEPQSADVLLLRDMAEVFQTKHWERLCSTDTVDALCALEESPWNEWRGGKPISPRGIAKLLKPFGVSPAQDRFGSFYRYPDFTDAFGRYLSDTFKKSATSAASATTYEGEI